MLGIKIGLAGLTLVGPTILIINPLDINGGLYF